MALFEQSSGHLLPVDLVAYLDQLSPWMHPSLLWIAAQLWEPVALTAFLNHHDLLGHVQHSMQLNSSSDSYAVLQHMAMPAPTCKVLLAAMKGVVRIAAAEHVDPLSVGPFDD